jgi:hypothetical protein
MADILRIKRRATGSPGAPASLANAEIAYNEVDHTLYYGEGTGGAGGSATTVVPIGGSGMGSGSNPLMNGASAVPGTGTLWSRFDHVHPTDTSRYAASNPSGYQTAAQVVANRLDQFQPPNVDVSWNSHKITGLLDPTNPQEAATKAYVDLTAQGLDAKASVRVATTTTITLSGTQTVDGVALAPFDRVLVKDQTTASANGIYTVAAGGWPRATDADTWTELISAYVFVESGTQNPDTGWLCTVDQGGTLGTTNVTWVQFSGAGQLNAGQGLTKTGNTIDANGTANRITVGVDTIDIASTYVGQATITTLGTITTGTWQGSVQGVQWGGTGAATLTGYVKGNGTSAFTASATIPNADIAGLGSMALQNATAVAITGGTIDGITLDCGTF